MIMKTVQSDNVVLPKNAPVKGLRKLFQPLQVSAIDKENLVGSSGRVNSVKGMPEKLVANSKTKEFKETLKATVTIEDLTSDTPNGNYWELKCKTLTEALERALKENEVLHERVALLEEENSLCKSQLYETAEIISVLTEIINEDNER